MSTPAAKRRRLEIASSTLTKPFRSPFITPLKKDPANSTSEPAAEEEETLPVHKAPSTGAAFKDPFRIVSTKITLEETEEGKALDDAYVLPAHPSTMTPFKPLFQKPATTKPAFNPLVSKGASSTPAFKPIIRRSAPQVASKLNTSVSTLRNNATSARGKLLSPIGMANLNADPEFVVLLRKQRELEKRLKELKEELDVAEQARKIEVKSEKKGDKEVDGELKFLVGKWKNASRAAAEDLFGGVKDRINKAGGPRAWKESLKRQQEDQAAWEAANRMAEQQVLENSDNDESDEDDDEETKEYKRTRRELKASRIDYGYDSVGAEDEWNSETDLEKEEREVKVVIDESPEDEYTMGEMLKTLNVPIDVIGYDAVGQRWDD